MIKVGIGQDSHRFEKNITKPLVLGGIIIPNCQGLKANSDGDVVIHALCNALSSSIGKGSLSIYADNLCQKQKITDSKEYLKVAFGFIKKEKYKVNNISISIETKKPRLEKYFPKMKQKIADLCHINEENVGITVTSGEGLTSFGKGLGIQVFAAITIIKC